MEQIPGTHSSHWNCLGLQYNQPSLQSSQISRWRAQSPQAWSRWLQPGTPIQTSRNALGYETAIILINKNYTRVDTPQTLHQFGNFAVHCIATVINYMVLLVREATTSKLLSLLTSAVRIYNLYK